LALGLAFLDVEQQEFAFSNILALPQTSQPVITMGMHQLTPHRQTNPPGFKDFSIRPRRDAILVGAANKCIW
jgi:hypothetical protein